MIRIIDIEGVFVLIEKYNRFCLDIFSNQNENKNHGRIINWIKSINIESEREREGKSESKKVRKS